MKHLNFTFTVVALVILVAGAAAPGVSAKKLDEAEIYIEINDTDGDAGIQVFLDGEGWDSMQMTGPRGAVLFSVLAEGSVGMQGITEFFFESAEPSFDEQSLEELLELFPAGKYKLRGTTTDNKPLRGRARLTHRIPAAPVLVSPEDGEEDVDPDDTVIEWMPVSEIVGYQVIVETDDDPLMVFSADVGPGVTSITVPPEFMMSGTAYKYEVLAVEGSGNQTISEAEFETE